MEKYQFTGTQVSFRVNNEERNELNQLATELQDENNVQFNNAKDLTFAIIDKLKQARNEAPRQEAEVVEVLPAHLAEKFAAIKADIFENKELTELQMLETLISIVTTPTPAVEIEKEIEKVVEVERAISESEVLVTMQPAQKQILQRIADWRFTKGKDNQKLATGDVMRKMCFNMATLTDYGEMFETGISEREFKRNFRKPQNH